MKLKKMLWSMIGLVPIAITPIIMTSCSSTTNTTSNKGDVGLKQYTSLEQIKKQNSLIKNVKEGTTETPSTTPEKKPEEKLVLDPNLSEDANNKGKDSFKNQLEKEKLQIEFDKVLSKFYKIYEYEHESKDDKTEVEAEIEKIEVEKFTSDTLEAKLKVTYKVETETEKDDKKDENTKTEIHDKTITINPMFATEMEIKHLTETLKKFKKGDVEQGNNKIDIEDLYELYVGDQNDGKKSIFEQLDIYLSGQNKFGGLLGYELKIEDLAYTPKKQEKKQLREKEETKPNTSLKDIKIFAPSFIVKEFYQPDKILSNGIDLTLNYDVLKIKTETDIKAISADKEKLFEILKNQPKDEETKKLITKVEVKETTNTDGSTPPASLFSTNKTNGEGVVPPTTKPEEGLLDKNSILLEITVKESKDSEKLILVTLEIKKDWLKKETTTPPTPPTPSSPKIFL